jgi:hypothetical protein
MNADDVADLTTRLRTLADYLEQGVDPRRVVAGLASIVARHLDDCAAGECIPPVPAVDR